MNIQWMRLIVINLIFLTTFVMTDTIRYSINVQPGFGKETWHPKLSRNYINDGSFELVDDRKTKYQTSLIQIQNKFLGGNTPKLQCECRFVKDTTIAEVQPQKDIDITQKTKLNLEPIASVEKSNQPRQSPGCNTDLVKTLTKRLEENNVLMNQINNYLGNESQNKNMNRNMIVQPNQPMQSLQPIFALQQPLVPAAPISYQYPYITSNMPPTYNPYPMYPPLSYVNPYVK